MRIVVVGAGILGASTAYHLARDGADVSIVDQAHDGQATAAGAGIICPWASCVDDPAFYELYSAHARTRKSAGSMTRKLSVTWSQ